MRLRLPAAALAVGCLSVGTLASAQVGLTVHQLPARGVRVDGGLGDWKGVRFARVGQGSDAAMRYALAYDDDGLYIAAEVADERLIRTRRPGKKEDAVIVTLALPQRGGKLRGVELWLFAGEQGKSRASASIGRLGGALRPLRGVEIVEGPRRGGRGYVLEALVPWRAIPGSARWQQGGRGAIRLRDVDMAAHPKVESEPASARVNARALQRLPELMPTGGPSALLRKFKQAKSLGGTNPRFDLSGDVTGDRQPERVVILDQFLVVLGPGYRNGEAYDFVALPVGGGNDVRHAKLYDLTGNGKKELTVRMRQSNEHGSRDVWRVFHFEGRKIRPGFGVELRKQTSDGAVEARLKLRRARRGPPVVEVRAGRARGLDADSYREAQARDAQPILLPWGPVKARRYQWNGQRFEKVAEQENPAYERQQKRRARARREQREQSQTRSRREPAQRKPSARELIAQVRKQRGIPASVRPRFRKNVNVIGDRQPETLMVLGKALVGVGPGFDDGRGFFYYELPAESSEDLRGVRTLDITGDGAAEVAIRVRQKLGTLESGGPPVYREVLLVHCFHGGGFPRVIALEVARAQGKKRLRNDVRVVRAGKRQALQIGPGKARGWNQSNWPFAEGGADDGVTPLLLPWRDEPVRHMFAGGRMVRR